MGFLDTLLGRTKPAKPNLDALFALPSAAITLQAASGLTPTGTGSVCFKAAEGASFESLRADAEKLLQADSQQVEETKDEYGYTWIVVRSSADVSSLVTDLHVVNSTLEGAGFGGSLLCTVVGFSGKVDGTDRSVSLVYLYKRGTFYPFAPVGSDKRDNAFELQIRAVVEDDLRIEPDLSRWFPVWGAPGL